MNCLLCHSDENKIYAELESFGFPLSYYQCDICGLIFQSPEKSRAANPEFYAETYRKVYQASSEPTAKDLWVQEQRAWNLTGILQLVSIGSPGRMLDVGASAGVLMNTFQEYFGCEVVGVEPGEAYRSYAESRGLQMYASLDALIEADTRKFDLVSMIHVLEHLPDPVGMLRTIRRELLSESGALLLEVPNFYAHDSFELAHLVCYTAHTVTEVLKQAGFQTVFLHKHGIPRSSLLNLYLTLIALPLSPGTETPPIQPDRMVQAKRQAGLTYRRVVQKLMPGKAWLPLPDEEEN